KLPAKKKDDSVARAIDEGWEAAAIQVPIEVNAPSENRIDVSRASFWAVPESELPREDSVCDLSLADIEVVEGAPQSDERITVLQTTLESIDALCAQGRYD